MTNFEGLGLSQQMCKSLARMNYTVPTPIQEKAIPMALDGHDILGSAQTGTGKTAAFGIPLVEALLRSDSGSALVLTPTRELAKQVMDVIHQLIGRESNINTAFIIGGEQYGKQYAQLKANPRVIIGTPGRINDHLERGTLKLHDTGFLVLDETDRMLDMGFGVQLERIAKFLPAERQTLMFSATIPKEIVRLSSQYLTNPQRISMGATNVVAQNIKQEVIRIEQDQKYGELMNQLHERNGSVIVFVKTKYNADKMAKKLRQDGFTSEALHGDLRQNKREKVMRNFRSQNFRILIATDIAARGLDVPHIEHVVNYDLPQVAEDFIHRMGRTARAGSKGSALSFVSNQDGRKWHAIMTLIDPESVANDRGGRGDKQGRGGRGRGKPQARGHAGNAPKRNDRGGDWKAKKPFGGARRVEEKENGEKRTYAGDKPRYNQDRPSGDRKPYAGDKPRRDGEFRGNGEKRAYSGDKPRYNNERPQGEKRTFAGDKPRYNQDRPNGDRKPYAGKPRFNDERPQGEKKSFGDRPRRDGDFKGGEKRAEGQNFEGRKPAPKGQFVKGKKSFGGGDKPYQNAALQKAANHSAAQANVLTSKAQRKMSLSNISTT